MSFHQPGGGPPFNPYAPPAHNPPPYGPPPGYGPYGYGRPPMHAPASGNATTALILAVVGWAACGCFTSIPGWWMARAELQRIDRGESSPAGRGMAQAAYWIALVNMILYVLLLGYAFVMFAVMFAQEGVR